MFEHITKEDVGKRIRELRKNHKLSINEFAEKTGRARNTIHYWEKGTHLPDVMDLIRISEIFDTTTDYILGKTDDPVNSTAQKEKELEDKMKDFTIQWKGEEVDKEIFNAILTNILLKK